MFTLPLPRTSETPKTHAPPHLKGMQTGIAITPALPQIHILLADDVAVNRRIIEAYLKKTGVLIDIAENGQDAIEKYRNGGIDLILMDMERPIMDGFEATRHIRKLETERGATPVPIVALTAHAFSEARQRCLNAGCSHFFTKPIRKAELLKLLQDIFNPSGSSG